MTHPLCQAVIVPAMVLSLFVSAHSRANAQEVTGRVLDAATGEPIGTAELALVGYEGELVALAVSDSSGWFRLRLVAPGVYRLEASGPGYASTTVDSVRVDSREEVAVELRLGPRPFEVDAITVLARRPMVPGPLRDFYWRAEQHAKTGRGVVVDRVELEEFHGQSARRVLAQQVFVKETVRGGPARILVKKRLLKFGGDTHCEPDYYLDGLPVDALAVLAIPASDLEGIEIYRGVSEVPAFFHRTQNSMECGVLLAWIRRG